MVPTPNRNWGPTISPKDYCQNCDSNSPPSSFHLTSKTWVNTGNCSCGSKTSSATL